MSNSRLLSSIVFTLFLTNNSIGVYICGNPPFLYYTLEPCSTQIPQAVGGREDFVCPNGGAPLSRRCLTAADCQYQAEAVGPAMGNCYDGRCCSAAYETTCANHGRPLGRRCRSDSECERWNGVCSLHQCCSQPADLLCPSGWLLSAFRCQWSGQCRVDVNGQPTDGECRQGRCCFPGRTPTVGCQQNEQPTGALCLRDFDCSRTSLWAAAFCRNGQCCERRGVTLNSPPGRCDKGGSPVAVQCTHDVQCWQVARSLNQRAICQNGNCCVFTCSDGGRSIGRGCGPNA